MPTQQSFAERYGPWAVVTGASSGIGRELARQIAARGVSVVLVARRRDRLEELAGEIVTRNHVEAAPLALDLSEADAVEALLQAVDGKDVGLVACNAGLGAKGPHHETPPERIRDLVQVNCTVPALMAAAFAPRLVERGRGAILFTGSIEGRIGFAHSAVYSASKAFVRSLGEAVWAELHPHGVDVLVLAPGATDTEILPAQGFRRDAMAGLMRPAAVARAALEHLDDGPEYVPGVQNRLLVGALAVLPRKAAVRLAARGMKDTLERSRAGHH